MEYKHIDVNYYILLILLDIIFEDLHMSCFLHTRFSSAQSNQKATLFLHVIHQARSYDFKFGEARRSKVGEARV